MSILNGTDALLAVETPTSVVLSSPAALRRMVSSSLLIYRAANEARTPCASSHWFECMERHSDKYVGGDVFGTRGAVQPLRHS